MKDWKLKWFQTVEVRRGHPAGFKVAVERYISELKECCSLSVTDLKRY